MTGRTDPPDRLTRIEQDLRVDAYPGPRAADVRWLVVKLRAAREQATELRASLALSKESCHAGWERAHTAEAELAAAHHVIQAAREAVGTPDKMGPAWSLDGSQDSALASVGEALAVFDANHPAPK